MVMNLQAPHVFECLWLESAVMPSPCLIFLKQAHPSKRIKGSIVKMFKANYKLTAS